MSAKRTKRTALILVGVHRGKIATVDKIRPAEDTCRVTVGNEQYGLSLSAIAFEDQDAGSDFGGFTPDEALFLDLD